ncbi:helix-turn-helix transcriptional regulator [Angustibacter peucedani]
MPQDDSDRVVEPPGTRLRAWLDEHGMTQRAFADEVGLSYRHLNVLIKGRSALTPRMALRLERATSIPAMTWSRLEAEYRDSLLRSRDTARS